MLKILTRRTDTYPIDIKMAPRAGLEPATTRLTAECSTIELSRNIDLLAILLGQS